MKRQLYWFTNDLRIRDNPILEEVLRSDFPHFLYVQDESLTENSDLGFSRTSDKRLKFLDTALTNLNDNLASLGQLLSVQRGKPDEVISSYIKQNQIEHLHVARQFGWYELTTLSTIKQKYPQLKVTEHDVTTLYTLDDIKSLLENITKGFSPFRNKTKKLPVREVHHYSNNLSLIDGTHHSDAIWQANELSAQEHMDSYFRSEQPQHYKATRDALTGWKFTTKLSPWLNHGILSPSQVMAALKKHEDNYGSNESTYWIYFELLWREYFIWLAHELGPKIYHLKGLRDKPPAYDKDKEALESWRTGDTESDLVNASMRELNATGYLTNRARQIVASYLVNELNQDWRYGAAWFERCLLDYHPAVNWGNWQYIAGVGVDPRGGRHFNIEKQTERFDPDGKYRDKWLESAHAA